MSLNIWLGLVNSIIATILGVFVFFYNRKSITNKFFSFSIFAVAIWSLTVIFADISRSITDALFWSQLAIVGPVFIPSFFLLFSFSFTGQNFLRKKNRMIFLILLPSLILSLFIFSPWNVEKVKIESWGTNFTPGILYWVLMCILIPYIGLSLWILYRRLRSADEKERLQIIYIFIGVLLSTILGIIGGLLLPSIGLGRASSFGPASTLIFIGLTTYAIIRKELFGVKVLLTTLLVSLITILLSIDLLFFSNGTAAKIAKLFVLIIFLYFGYMLIKSVLKEIERRKQLEKLTKALEKANIQLKKLDKAKSEFVSIASHQLRTPLTAIKGYISMALEGIYGPLDGRFKKALVNVYGSNEELINLVNDLLNISRIEAGKIKLEPEPTDLKVVIDEVVQKLKINAEQRDLYINQEPISVPKISLDKEKIKQVILNIVDNAIKYTQTGGVIVSAKKEGRAIVIKVSDTGIGMSQEEISNLFISFKRGDISAKFHTEGSGLGLYIAKKFVDMHKGKIWAKSEGKGHGSQFYISLPC